MKARGRPRHPDVLTPAEWRVVHAVRHGMSNRQIARRAGVSLDAVKYHVANALAKLGLAGRAELRAWRGVPADSPLARAAGGRGADVGTDLKLGAIGQIARPAKDIEAAVRWYRDVHLVHRHESGMEEWMAFFADPDGHPLALMAQVPAQGSAQGSA